MQVELEKYVVTLQLEKYELEKYKPDSTTSNLLANSCSPGSHSVQSGVSELGLTQQGVCMAQLVGAPMQVQFVSAHSISSGACCYAFTQADVTVSMLLRMVGFGHCVAHTGGMKFEVACLDIYSPI